MTIILNLAIFLVDQKNVFSYFHYDFYRCFYKFPTYFSSFRQNSFNQSFSSLNLSGPTRYVSAPSDWVLWVGEATACRICSSFESTKLGTGNSSYFTHNNITADLPVFLINIINILLVIQHTVNLLTNSRNSALKISKLGIELKKIFLIL